VKPFLLELLRCLKCRRGFEPIPFAREGERVIDGVLRCGGCAQDVFVVGGVPRFVPPTYYDFGAFRDRHRESLARCAPHSLESIERQYPKIKSLTQESFGFEWTTFDRFGWEDSRFNLAREEKVFRSKSLMEEEDLGGAIALDAGCGNGRYSYWASKLGAREVVGVDLGQGVDSAYRNTLALGNVHVLQGDLFNLPFDGPAFDRIFSIGVLMHTGNARQAFLALARLLKPGGQITAHVYHKGNAIYEFNDRWIRGLSVRIRPPVLHRLSRWAASLGRELKTLGLLKLLVLSMRFEPHPALIYDWYSAPIATHHTYPEVRAWFAEAGLRVVKTNEKPYPFPRNLHKRYINPPLAMTVKGARP
jgi:SAM-dependent methyltransferase